MRQVLFQLSYHRLGLVQEVHSEIRDKSSSNSSSSSSSSSSRGSRSSSSKGAAAATTTKASKTAKQSLQHVYLVRDQFQARYVRILPHSPAFSRILPHSPAFSCILPHSPAFSRIFVQAIFLPSKQRKLVIYTGKGKHAFL